MEWGRVGWVGPSGRGVGWAMGWVGGRGVSASKIELKVGGL